MAQQIENLNLTVMDHNDFDKEWKIIGAGGDPNKGLGSQVHKTRHLQSGKDVAIKIIFCDDGSNEALLREAELMLRGEGPYMMKALGIFRGCLPHCPGLIQVGLVMDLMKRGSLYSLQRERKRQLLPWPLVFRLANQVAEGMNYLHSITPDPIIHKDLKDENILLDADLNVMITDLGIAKFAKDVTARPLQGMRTAFFAPPESEQGGATPAYDVYSYAIVVWIILNPAHVIAKGVNSYQDGTRPSLEAVETMTAPGLDELVKLMVRCWNTDPKSRPTFAECAVVTGRLYWKYGKSGINDAIKQVQLDLDGAPAEEVVQQDGAPAEEVVQQDGAPAEEVVQQDGAPAEEVVQQDGAPAEEVVQQDGAPAEEVVQQDGAPAKEVVVRDFQRLTLDTNTTHRWLSLSEKNKKVTHEWRDHSYPDHSDRFDVWDQVLCTESLTGRCYWEVEWSGYRVDIAVTYRGIRRKGRGLDSLLGYNDKSWRLRCEDKYTVRHNGEWTVLPVRPSVSTRVDEYGRPVYRVAVYVDHPAGTLSFYAVSSDTLTHLHTFQTTFTEPLYAGFYVGGDSSVCLCE